jgi:hypothetical protein
VTIAEGFVLPNIHSVLLPKKSGKKVGLWVESACYWLCNVVLLQHLFAVCRG